MCGKLEEDRITIGHHVKLPEVIISTARLGVENRQTSRAQMRMLSKQKHQDKHFFKSLSTLLNAYFLKVVEDRGQMHTSLFLSKALESKHGH